MEALSLPPAITNALAALLVFALAYGLIRIGTLQYSLIAPSDADAVPLLHVMAIAGGAALGVLLLASLPYGEDFRPSRLYAADSPWDIGVLEFLRRHALPGHAAMVEAGRVLRQGAGSPWQTLPGYCGLALAGLAAVQGVFLWRGVARLRAALACLLLAGWTALVVHYLAHLLAWSAAQLNFWLFALLLVLWQRARYSPRARAH